MANFTIDPEDLVQQRIANRLTVAEGLPETGANLEIRNPTVTAMPNAAANSQGMASPEQINYLMGNLEQRFNPTQGEAPVVGPSGGRTPGEDFMRGPEKALVAMGTPPEIAKELAKHISDNGPPKLVGGKDLFGEGRGGIFGTGISPLDALFYAIGAGVTSNLPQDQALQWMGRIGGFPAQLKEAQRKAGADYINTLLGISSTATQQQNTRLRGQEQTFREEERQGLHQWADMVAEQAASGVPFTAAKRLQMMALGAKYKIPTDLMKQTLELHPAEQLAQVETIKRILGNRDVETRITLPGGVTVIDRPEKTGGAQDLTQATRQELAIAAAKGEKISLEVAVERATARQAAAAGQKAEATSKATPVSGEAANVINMGQEVQKQLQIMNENLNEGVKLLGPKHLSKTYTETILPMTRLSEGQAKFLQAYLRLRQLDKVPITGAAAAVEEMKSLFATLPQMIANEKNFRTNLKTTTENAQGWTQRYGAMVTQPKSETGKQFKRPEGARKVED